MKREVINRGYLTYSLTDSNGVIYGLYKTRCYDWRFKELYWSEVFVDGNAFAIVRQGERIEGKTDKEMNELLEQSFVNLGWVDRGTF